MAADGEALVGGLLVVGLLGVRDGVVRREEQRATDVAVHFERGLQHVSSGEEILARAEFGRVLELDPEHLRALAQVRNLERSEASRGTPIEIPVSTRTPIRTAPPTTPQA